MPVLRSGLVIAGRYADKVRRVLFAQLKDSIKSGEISAQEVARAAGELNRLLFEILVNALKIDKGDVVRISVEYEVAEGSIKWRLETLSIQAWRRIPDEEVQPAVKSIIEKAGEILAGEPEYQVEKTGETDTGDIVYRLIYAGEEAGALLLTPINGKAIVRLAVTQPTAKVIRKKVVDLPSGELDEAVKSLLPQLLREAEDTEKRLAERVYREILALIQVEEEEEEAEE